MGEMLQRSWREILGLADRRGKFPDYLSFTVKQKKIQKNAWNIFAVTDNWSSGSENRIYHLSLHHIKHYKTLRKGHGERVECRFTYFL